MMSNIYPRVILSGVEECLLKHVSTTLKMTFNKLVFLLFIFFDSHILLYIFSFIKNTREKQ